MNQHRVIEMGKCIYCEVYISSINEYDEQVCIVCAPRVEADEITDDILSGLEDAIKLMEESGQNVFSHREEELKLIIKGLSSLILNEIKKNE